MSGCRNISVGKFCCKRRCNYFRLYLAAAALIFAPSHIAVSYNNALALELKFRNQTFSAGLKLPSADSTFISKEYSLPWFNLYEKLL